MLTQFTGNLSCTVEAGQIFVIGARPIDDAERVNINFQSGKSDEADIILHLSIRFHDDIIVRNSKLGGSWGGEERDENLNELTAPNPTTPGDVFKLYILIGDDRFHIAINGHPYCTYGFRAALSEIRSIWWSRMSNRLCRWTIDRRSPRLFRLSSLMNRSTRSATMYRRHFCQDTSS